MKSGLHFYGQNCKLFVSSVFEHSEFWRTSSMCKSFSDSTLLYCWLSISFRHPFHVISVKISLRHFSSKHVCSSTPNKKHFSVKWAEFLHIEMKADLFESRLNVYSFSTFPFPFSIVIANKEFEFKIHYLHSMANIDVITKWLHTRENPHLAICCAKSSEWKENFWENYS